MRVNYKYLAKWITAFYTLFIQSSDFLYVRKILLKDFNGRLTSFKINIQITPEDLLEKKNIEVYFINIALKTGCNAIKFAQ